ncbi:hypothetical protein EYD10_18429 [Varanus komodoensis]|nr:hypothetical protein EYD10_18429 [Varanus komodoensis]
MMPPEAGAKLPFRMGRQDGGGVSSQITLTESGGGVKRPGETVQLTCAVSGVSLSNTEIHWVRQPPGKGLEWAGVVWSNGALNYNSALKNRLSISRDTSKGQVFLQVRDLKPEDSGLYYCARDTVRKCCSGDFCTCSEDRLQQTLMNNQAHDTNLGSCMGPAAIASQQRATWMEEFTCFRDSPLQHPFPPLLLCSTAAGQMERAGLSLVLPGVSSQITLTESGGGVKRPGETVQLTCALSGFSLTSRDMHWVRQPPGKGLEWAAAIDSSGGLYYNSGLKNRLSISRDTSKGQVFLQVRDLKPEDSALYYCASDTVRKCCSEDVQKHFFPQKAGMSHSALCL